MFLNPANSDTKNGIKKNQKYRLKKNHVQRKLEDWKNEIYQNKTVIRGLPNFKKILYFYTLFLYPPT